MSLPTVPLPEEVSYGYVTGRFVLIVGDSTDEDALPDIRPATGLKATFSPAVKSQKVPYSALPTTLLRADLTCEVGPDGFIREVGTTDPGVWLVVGTYDVKFSGLSSHSMPAPLTIEVTADHSEELPLDLTLAGM